MYFYGVNLYCSCVHRMIALMSPEDSWVAKWQKISKYLL